MSVNNTNTILMILANLRHAIQYTSNGEERQYVNRKHINNIANKLRDVLKQAQVTHNNAKEADPYWYINVLQLLSGAVRGKDGIKYLIDIVMIIESLLRKIHTLETANTSILEQAIVQYENTSDESSLTSLEADKELIETFLNSDINILRNRGKTLILIRGYLEVFLRNQGYRSIDLYNSCVSYSEDHPGYERYMKSIRSGGNLAVHDWRDTDECVKQSQVKAVRQAIDGFLPFKEYLESQVTI